MKYLIIFLTLNLYALSIIDRPIPFDGKRINLTKAYISKHYGLKVDNTKIKPRIIAIHWTGINDFNTSYNRFINTSLPADRPDIYKASALNVSTHFMVKRDGTVYRLMGETDMGRHIIGLNYSSIGIENVGGANNKDNLTPSQLQANIQLIQYLQEKYKSIDYLIGHHEYTHCVKIPLWLEKDDNYRTKKYDPGLSFMKKLRLNFPTLKSCNKENL